MNQSLLNSVSRLCTLIALALAGCSAVRPASRARFESADCKLPVPTSIPNKIECGTLFVPEDRSRKDRTIIQLHVAIVRSQNPNPAPDAVVYLEGGWADRALANLAGIIPKFQDVLKSRDLIVFDQRGVGYSEPSLDCPEIPAQVSRDMKQKAGRGERVQHYIEATQACRDRLVKEGIDLAAYTTLANAADVNDLRLALGYSEWNLYGISYGTRLALTVMRHYPKGVRSAILDSVYPVQKNVFVEEALALQRSLDLVAERCAADPACYRKYPDPVTVFYNLVDQLDVEPRGYMDGNSLIETVWGMLYSAGAIPYLPQRLYQFQSGNWSHLPLQPGSLAVNDQPGPMTMSEGKRFSVICAEEVAHTSAAEVAASRANVPPRLAAFFNEPIFEICSFWGAKPVDSKENEAVISDIPALILQGDYDPATPPAWSRLAVQTLSRAQYFEFPGISHSVLGAGVDGGTCSKSITDAFLANPMAVPDSSCLGKIKPYFITISN